MTSIPLSATMTSTHVDRATLSRLWLLAAGVAAVAAAVIFEASIGINWLLAIVAVSLALGHIARRTHTLHLVARPLALASFLGIGMTMTASPFLHFLSVVGVLVLVSVAIARTQPAHYESLPFIGVVAIPALTAAHCAAESLNQVAATTRAVTGERAAPIVRGVLVAAPVAIVFAVLLSSADPTLDAWRTSLDEMLKSLDFLPRLVFFVMILGLGLGALGYAVRRDVRAASMPEFPLRISFGASERQIVLGTIAVLFTLFLTLQLRYLFGDVASVPGSGVTYAEWARRGFAELTVVATLCAGILLFFASHAPAGHARRRILALELIVIGETQVLLQSAFRRVLLYEEAYGYTTARVFAQAYMVVIAAGLLLLAYELVRGPEVRRVMARVAVLGISAVLALSLWNHEAWIVRQNVARYATTGKLDTRYLACELSMSGVPALLGSIGTLDGLHVAQVREALDDRFASRRTDRWFEWNRDRARGVRAMQAADIVDTPQAAPLSACSREWT